jgi:phosphate starvation-inducible protein PhoH
MEDPINLGTSGTKKKQPRKLKKQTEKEIMQEYMSEQPQSNLVVKQQRKVYENFQYLSHAERELFDQRFTKPKTQSQEIYNSMLKAKSKKIILATGPAGTGKTLFATEHGVRYFLMGIYDKLIFTRPSVSVDEDLGFLPGTLEDKMAPWVRPIYDVLHQFISPKEVQSLLEEKVIEIAPLGYMRGLSLIHI